MYSKAPYIQTVAIISIVLSLLGHRTLSLDDEPEAHPSLKFSSSRSEVCVYGNQTYSPGERFRPNPCTSCHCSRHGGRPLCAVHDCAYEPSCVRRDMRKDECCGRCVEYGCLHSDGRVYPAGSAISDTDCNACECVDSKNQIEGGKKEELDDADPGASLGSAVIVVCRKKFTCPEVTCVDSIVDPDRKCCMKCPNGENCWLGEKIIKAGELVASDGMEDGVRVCRSCFCPPSSTIPFWRRSSGLHAVCGDPRLC